MAIKRLKSNNNYTIINNTAFRDERLSAKAKGLLAYMLTMPDDWTFYETELTNHFKDGRDGLRSGLKELQDARYLVRERKRNDNGTFAETDWILYEVPQPEKPKVEMPKVEIPILDNTTLLSTNSTKNLNTQNTNNIKPLSSKPDRIPYKEIIDYLNEKAGKQFKNVDTHKKLIRARWHEGYTLDNFKQVIDIKVAEWANNADMAKFLQPSTLFGNKFDKYLNQPMPVDRRKPVVAGVNYNANNQTGIEF